MLTKEQKAKWIKALRSGQYQQGSYCLRRYRPDFGDQYCCLGVLADILDKDKWIFQVVVEGGQISFAWDKENPRSSMLDFCILDDAAQAKLMHFNDYDALNFRQIADWIETNLETSD